MKTVLSVIAMPMKMMRNAYGARKLLTEENSDQAKKTDMRKIHDDTEMTMMTTKTMLSALF